MAEYLLAEFPGLDVYSGIQQPHIYNRVYDMRFSDGGWWDIFHLYEENPKLPDVELVPVTPEREARSSNGWLWKWFHGWWSYNTEEWRRAEFLSANISASARGLAKLGTFMANKGTVDGKTIMSEASWQDFHANPDV